MTGTQQQGTAALYFRNDDAEKATLAAFLIDLDFATDAFQQLTADDFANGQHKDIFIALHTIYDGGMPLDFALLADELRKRHGWTDAETNEFYDLPRYATHAFTGRDHLPVLKRYSYLRKMAAFVPGLYEMDARGATIEDLHQYAQAFIEGTRVTVQDGDDEEEPEPSPLATVQAGDLRLGWIDDYADLMTRLTGSPREFNRLCGLVTAAAAIQRRAVLRMAFGDIYPNVYGAIIAKSSVYHKSSALSKPRALLKRAMLDHLLLSELATSEGLLKELAVQSSGLIVRDEIGTLFASHNQKYLITLKPDLTALFDCAPYSRRLSNDHIRVDAPYLSILGATTPARFYEGITFTDWADGFLARWLFVLPEGEPNFDAMTGLYTQDQDAEIGRLAVTLVNIDRQRDTDFILKGDAHKLWDAWQRDAAKQAYFYGDDVVAAVTTRYAAYALKFATILAAVNGSWGTITEETMQTAISLADSFKRNVNTLLAEKANYGMSGAKLQKVFAVIKRKGGAGGATRKTVTQFANMRAGDVTLCLDKLIEIGAVIENREGRASRFIAVEGNLPMKSWK